MAVHVIDQICSGTGKGVCEDTLAIVGDKLHGSAWVIDGATGLGDHEYISNTESDAAWYAQTLSHALKQFWLAGVPQSVFRSAIADVAQRYEALVERAAVPAYAIPSAAGVWLRWQDNRFDYASTGDCRVLIKTDNKPIELIGLEAKFFNDAQRNKQIAKLRDEHNLQTADDIFRFFLPHNREARSGMNTDYVIFNLSEQTPHQMAVEQFTLNAPSFILLMSDGLFRLVDTIPIYTQETLMNAALERGLAALLQELRQFEDNDPHCQDYPRTKRHDDVSAVLLRFEPG